MSQVKERQGLLFSEPSIAETGVWCSLNEGIDPGEWASLCRYIGKMSPREFGIVRRKVVGRQGRMAGMPLVSISRFVVKSKSYRNGTNVIGMKLKI